MKRTLLSMLFFMTAGLVTLTWVALAQDNAPIPHPSRGPYLTYGRLRGVTTDERCRRERLETEIPRNCGSRERKRADVRRGRLGWFIASDVGAKWLCL